MKNECSIVRDILPLYLEGMLSEDTTAFVREHLESCAECRAELESLRSPKKTVQPDGCALDRPEEEALALRKLKKKLNKRISLTAGLIAACLLTVLTLIYHFPLYRIAKVWCPYPGYFDAEEISMLAYIGSVADRAKANTVLRLAEEAFSDLTHTHDENKEKYGLLSRYATAAERGAVAESHSLKLWSAHFDNAEGYIWVYYSQEAYDANGKTICGSWDIPSLWHVEKNADGKWIVTKIDEHP